MTRGIWIAMTIVGSFSLMGSISHAQVGYAWADQPGVEKYQPNPGFAHNDAGGGIFLRKNSIGNYVVRFERLGGRGKGGGHAQVTAYGGQRGICNVAGWDSRVNDGRDFEVRVICFSLNGSPADLQFAVLAGWPGGRSTAAATSRRPDPVQHVEFAQPSPENKSTEGDIEALWGIVEALAARVNTMADRLNRLPE